MSNKLNGAKIISDAKHKAEKIKQAKKETTTMKTKIKTIAKTVLTFAAGIALTLASLWVYNTIYAQGFEAGKAAKAAETAMIVTAVEQSKQ